MCQQNMNCQMSLSPVGMFSALLCVCALLPAVCQAPDTECLGLLISRCWFIAENILWQRPFIEQKCWLLLAYKLIVSVF